mgnify:CR=1 FL=1
MKSRPGIKFDLPRPKEANVKKQMTQIAQDSVASWGSKKQADTSGEFSPIIIKKTGKKGGNK